MQQVALCQLQHALSPQTPAGDRNVVGYQGAHRTNAMEDEGAHEQIWGLQNKHQPGKWRPILDISQPENHGINA